MAVPVNCHWSSFQNSPNPIAKCRCAPGCRAPRRPTYSVNSVNLVLLDLLGLLSSSRRLEVTTVTFFKWLFTKMAVSMVTDRESEQELAESHLMLMNSWLCFRTSSSFVGNNPSLQIQSFSEDRGKCNKTGNPSISDFSTILTSHILILADSSYLPSGEAYQQRLSLSYYRSSTPCYECKPNLGVILSTNFSWKHDSAGGKCVYSVTWHL